MENKSFQWSQFFCYFVRWLAVSCFNEDLFSNHLEKVFILFRHIILLSVILFNEKDNNITEK